MPGRDFTMIQRTDEFAISEILRRYEKAINTGDLDNWVSLCIASGSLN